MQLSSLLDLQVWLKKKNRPTTYFSYKKWLEQKFLNFITKSLCWDDNFLLSLPSVLPTSRCFLLLNEHFGHPKYDRKIKQRGKGIKYETTWGRREEWVVGMCAYVSVWWRRLLTSLLHFSTDSYNSLTM